MRADLLLVEKGLSETRARAQSLIMSGSVFADGQKISKSSQLIDPELSKLEVKGKNRFVSRGGEKLEGALKHFQIDVTGKICLDVGASTGGFTDCLLQRGAKKVYALDVGYGQLDQSLRKNPRVVVMDRVNFRYFDVGQIPEPVDLVTIDVSFISLTMIIPKVREIFVKIPPGGFSFLIALIKPQFEVGPKFLKKGIVRDEKKREESVGKIKNFCAGLGLNILGVTPSPIRGQKGNQEYFLVARYQPD